MDKKKVLNVEIRWRHYYGFRNGIWAKLLGVKFVEPNERDWKPRLCYLVMYEDGVTDLIPISEESNLEFRADRVENK